jgi:hypothetical protein
MRIKLIHIAPVLAVALASAGAHAQKLDKTRDEVREGGSGSGSKDQGAPNDQAPYWGDGTDVEDYQQATTCPPDDPYCEEASGAEILLGYCFGFAFWLPHALIEGDEPRPAWFPGYPYRGDNEGYMVFAEVPRPTPQVETTADGDILIGEGDEVIMPQPERSSPVALRLAVEYSHDLETVFKPWANLLFSTRWRFGLESGWAWLIEDRIDGTQDQLGIGDINLIFRFTQHEHVQMRTGAGVRLMIDKIGSDQQRPDDLPDADRETRVDAGFNWTYGFDLFPVQPLIFSASIDLGNLRRAFFVHGRAHLGVAIWAVEIYAGWDVTQIGDVTLHGPLIGLRAWF